MSAPASHPTAQQYVLTELRRAILSRELSPGDAIRQDALAERYGVSRVPLREALKVLEGEGQVTYLARRGYFVAELSLDDLVEVYRIRQLLEAEAARVAIEKITDEGVLALKAVLGDIERTSGAEDLAAMASANRQFHFMFLETCRLPRLIRLIGLLWDATDAYRSVYYGSDVNRSRVNREHRAIFAAIRKRDADRVISLLDAHRNHAITTLSSVISPTA